MSDVPVPQPADQLIDLLLALMRAADELELEPGAEPQPVQKAA